MVDSFNMGGRVKFQILYENTSILFTFTINYPSSLLGKRCRDLEGEGKVYSCIHVYYGMLSPESIYGSLISKRKRKKLSQMLRTKK